VVRSRLDDQLRGGIGNQVTLITGGPGFGKTTAVASWAGRGVAAPGVVAWLTVSSADNDLSTMWSDVLGALTVSGAVPAGSPLREITPAAAFGDAELHRVTAALAELPAPVDLVLDDFHAITNDAVLSSIDQLIEQHPVRLIIVTRSDPRLRLHRLRVNGQLTEIRSHDLAFTETEAANLFDNTGLHLDDRQLQLLLGRTRGWPAGLRLAAMSLEGTDIDRGIARFSGTDGSVAEYLVGEVLDGLPTGERDFLLTTSVPDRFTGDLATTLSGRADGQLILEKLIGANAFVLAHGDHREWFSYHPLFREMLAHRLAVEQPGAVRDLHLRAAGWFTTHGEPLEAIGHAIKAQDWDQVGHLMITASPLLLTAAGPALVATLEPVAARAAEHPGWSTLLAAAVCHYQRRDYDTMLLDADEASQFLTDAPPEDRQAAEALITVVRIVHARAHRCDTLTRVSADLLGLLDAAPRRMLPAGRYYRVIATNNLAGGQLWTGDLDTAETHLTDAETHAREMGMELAERNAQTHLALLDALHGRLSRAHRRATTTLQALDRRGWGSELQALPGYLALGLTHLARNQPDQAATQISRGLTAARSDQACRLALGIAAVDIAIHRGDVESTLAAAARLNEEHANAGVLPVMLDRWCAVTQAHVLLAAGDPAAAITTLDPTPVGDGFTGAQEALVRARAQLALGQPQTALEQLKPITGSAPAYLVHTVDALVMTAIALGRTHHTTGGLDAITTAIDLAQPEGILRPFTTAGFSIVEVVVQYQHLTARHSDFTDQILHAVTPAAARERVPLGRFEQLTDRELLVLRYLPTMLKASEIAGDLYLSVNTVKTHLQSIYRKLDVPTRREAVERARARNLI
jgi:LuxR family maltose regulon positive regulatory protein